jgi:acylaminoacyl-peptidase
LLSLTAAAQRRALSPEDLRLWRGDSDPRINSQGVSAVYTENWYGSAHYYSDIWLVDAKGKERRALSPGEWRDWSARWNPDGTEVAFLSDRSGKVQIYAMRMEPVGAATAVTRGDLTPLAFAWSPDGKWLAFTARVAADGARAAWAPASILPLVQAAGPGPVQVFLVAAGGGEAQRLTTSALDFSGEPAWMPDGRSLVCAAGGQIFSIRVADHAVRELTHNGMVNSEPVPAPDGSKIAWLAAEVKPQNYVVRHLWVMNAEGARDRMLGGALDRDVMHPQWSNDSRTVYFLADDQGSTHLYAGRNDGTARQATSRVERLSGFSLADNGRAVTVRSTGTEGGNVITFTTDVPGGVTTLSEPNGGLMADRHLAAVEEIHYESEGKSIQAWLVKPPQFDASKKYPLLLDVRDDPRAMYGVEFRLRQQILASAGYVVVCANPRGTPGYGEEFGHLLRTRSPGDDADDLLRGVEYVVKQGYVDEKRIGVVGGMTAAWLIGHTDRFSRAVLRRPLVDWAADLRRARAELGVWPWEDAELYTKRSPIFSMGSVKTPTLILAGEGDGQSEQLFYALQQRKVETVLVRSPDEVQELQAILGWMGR